jgi:hypothetical protein
MRALDSLKRSAGSWKGTYRLREVSHALSRSSSSASIAILLQGRFARVDYTWSHNGEPQEGSLLFGFERKRRLLTAVWIDSWHMGDKFMICQGAVKANGALSAVGFYGVPSGPDWGWRTVMEARGGNSFRMIMYNVSPDGKEELAVEASYSREAKTARSSR